jgi:hypothetical protein
MPPRSFSSPRGADREQVESCSCTRLRVSALHSETSRSKSCEPRLHYLNRRPAPEGSRNESDFGLAPATLEPAKKRRLFVCERIVDCSGIEEGHAAFDGRPALDGSDRLDRVCSPDRCGGESLISRTP